jgi:two-component system, NtrC family, response regulator AtoC
MGATPALEGSLIRSSDYLLVIEGERSWTVRLPASGELLMGRGPEAGLTLSDALVSRRHAQLLVGADGLRLTDLGSRHGTLVNGERLTGARPIRSGDVITLGSTLVVVQRPLRPSAAHHVVDLAGFTRRLDEENERAVYYQRELALAVLRAAAPFDPARTSAVLDSRLRLMDTAVLLGEQHVGLLLPEITADDAIQVAMELAPAIAPGDAPLACGVAVSPSDGLDGDTLVASARAAADVAPPGEVRLARDAIQQLQAGPHRIAIADPGMVQLYDLARRLARSSMPILIQGETGSGKELAAAAIHAFSPRANGPFVSINGAAIPEALAESELFGHARGAFSGAMMAKPGQFEAASGGTLFLDEIGELPAQVQAKLLRVLESGEITRVGEVKPRAIDVRVVAATNRDLEREVGEGRFRRDLFFRLGAARLELPPLRDRPRDIAVLARILLEETCERLGRAPLSLSITAAQTLFLHHWPGNVRELKNALAYAAAAAPDHASEIEGWHLPAPLATIARRAGDAGTAVLRPISPRAVLETLPESLALQASLRQAGLIEAALLEASAEPEPVRASGFRPIADEVRELERARMIEALRATGGVQNRAAERIGMPGRTFATKLKRYRIAPEDWSP